MHGPQVALPITFQENKIMIYFTADTHFGHDNIIRYCKRPFTSVDDMDETIINNWNSVVTDNDTIYILGDFLFRANRLDLVYNKLKVLNGNKILIKGNHEKQALNIQAKYNFFNKVSYYEEIRYNDVKICMFHYPIEEWNNKHHGSIHLHGHTHGNSPIVKNRFDVGVDVNNFSPISIEEILKRYEK